MGSVLHSTICHYCGERARTEDHVVPRCDLPKPQSTLPYWFRALNSVPACASCNNRKGPMRSDCHCEQCRQAWGTAKALFLPVGYVERGFIKIVRSPG